MRVLVLGGLLVVAAGCGGSREVVPLLSAAGIPLAQAITVPLEVVTRSTAVQDPLPVRGSDVSYADVEAALGHAVASATVPWAEAHRDRRAGAEGWQLFVEIINADAEYDDGRVIFSVSVRATLRARAGNVYLAQTQANCRQGGIAAPEKGAPVMYRCLMEVGHHLEGWLGGVDLDTAASAS
jgi:hypothetical protein